MDSIYTVSGASSSLFAFLRHEKAAATLAVAQAKPNSLEHTAASVRVALADQRLEALQTLLEKIEHQACEMAILNERAEGGEGYTVKALDYTEYIDHCEEVLEAVQTRFANDAFEIVSRMLESRCPVVVVVYQGDREVGTFYREM